MLVIRFDVNQKELPASSLSFRTIIRESHSRLNTLAKTHEKALKRPYLQRVSATDLGLAREGLSLGRVGVRPRSGHGFFLEVEDFGERDGSPADGR
jgi:hypothetical protein